MIALQPIAKAYSDFYDTGFNDDLTDDEPVGSEENVDEEYLDRPSISAVQRAMFSDDEPSQSQMRAVGVDPNDPMTVPEALTAAPARAVQAVLPAAERKQREVKVQDSEPARLRRAPRGVNAAEVDALDESAWAKLARRAPRPGRVRELTLPEQLIPERQRLEINDKGPVKGPMITSTMPTAPGPTTRRADAASLAWEEPEYKGDDSLVSRVGKIMSDNREDKMDLTRPKPAVRSNVAYLWLASGQGELAPLRAVLNSDQVKQLAKQWHVTENDFLTANDYTDLFRRTRAPAAVPINNQIADMLAGDDVQAKRLPPGYRNLVSHRATVKPVTRSEETVRVVSGRPLLTPTQQAQVDAVRRSLTPAQLQTLAGIQAESENLNGGGPGNCDSTTVADGVVKVLHEVVDYVDDEKSGSASTSSDEFSHLGAIDFTMSPEALLGKKYKYVRFNTFGTHSVLVLVKKGSDSATRMVKAVIDRIKHHYPSEKASDQHRLLVSVIGGVVKEELPGGSDLWSYNQDVDALIASEPTTEMSALPWTALQGTRLPDQPTASSTVAVTQKVNNGLGLLERECPAVFGDSETATEILTRMTPVYRNHVVRQCLPGRGDLGVECITDSEYAAVSTSLQGGKLSGLTSVLFPKDTLFGWIALLEQCGGLRSKISMVRSLYIAIQSALLEEFAVRTTTPTLNYLDYPLSDVSTSMKIGPAATLARLTVAGQWDRNVHVINMNELAVALSNKTIDNGWIALDALWLYVPNASDGRTNGALLSASSPLPELTYAAPAGELHNAGTAQAFSCQVQSCFGTIQMPGRTVVFVVPGNSAGAAVRTDNGAGVLGDVIVPRTVPTLPPPAVNNLAVTPAGVTQMIQDKEMDWNMRAYAAYLQKVGLSFQSDLRSVFTTLTMCVRTRFPKVYSDTADDLRMGSQLWPSVDMGLDNWFLETWTSDNQLPTGECELDLPGTQISFPTEGTFHPLLVAMRLLRPMEAIQDPVAALLPGVQQLRRFLKTQASRYANTAAVAYSAASVPPAFHYVDFTAGINYYHHSYWSRGTAVRGKIAQGMWTAGTYMRYKPNAEFPEPPVTTHFPSLQPVAERDWSWREEKAPPRLMMLSELMDAGWKVDQAGFNIMDTEYPKTWGNFYASTYNDTYAGAGLHATNHVPISGGGVLRWPVARIDGVDGGDDFMITPITVYWPKPRNLSGGVGTAMWSHTHLQMGPNSNVVALSVIKTSLRLIKWVYKAIDESDSNADPADTVTSLLGLQPVKAGYSTTAQSGGAEPSV